MADIKTISEKAVSLAEMREKLSEIKKRDKELNFRAKKTEEYLNLIVKTKPAKVDELKSELEKLNITRLKENQIVKVIDMLPKEIDSLKAIFANEPISLKQEDYEKILNVIKKHV